MSSQLLINIKQLINVSSVEEPLYGNQMSVLPSLHNAWVLTEGEAIADFGLMKTIHEQLPHLPADQTDCTGRLVLPCWCDSHSHLVFTGSREQEFVDKIQGLSYAEINARGGGILQTVRNVNEASEDQLFSASWERLTEISKTGTGAIEIKSGYGLSLEGELKMLRVIKRLKQQSPLEIRSTFLGAHTYPIAYRENHAAYINEITEIMLPAIAAEKLADYIDVFCEKGFFNPEETETILRAGLAHGLQPKLHVNQLNSIGGIQTGIRVKAVSMDHLETMADKDIQQLSASEWKGICTLLPAAAFFLRMSFPPARKLLGAGLALALASDYNPGSSPTGNMNLVVALACTQMKLLPEEAVNAATTNGAMAMGVGKLAGTIAIGKLANLMLSSPVPSLAYLPYRFGSNLIDRVMIRGSFVN